MAKVILVILDGWGWSPIAHGNLLLSTPTPGLDTLLGAGKGTLLRTASLEIGLPWGSVGDSELGHYNLGTGRIVVRRGTNAPTLERVLERERLIAEGLPPDVASHSRIRRLVRRHQTLTCPVSLASLVAAAGLTQTKLADATKKDALVTAMNGFPKTPIPGETFAAIPDEHDLPARLAHQPALLDPDLVVINLSLADRLAHTGELTATRQAIATTDRNLMVVADIAARTAAVLYLAADHGNIEQMWDSYDHPDPEHTTNPVLFLRIDFARRRQPLVFAPHPRRKLAMATGVPTGLLADIAPTTLDELEIPCPSEMVGISLRRYLLRN